MDAAPIRPTSISPEAGPSLMSLGAVTATAMIFGVTYSLSAAVIALDLAERGFGEGMIGANAAMHAVGVLAMAFLLPRLVPAIGMRRMVVGSLLVAGALLLLFPAAGLVWLWFPLRLLLGAASEALFVLSETWLNSLATERTRARAMAAYTAALSVGFALGPLILSAVGSEGALPYLVGAVLSGAAAGLVALPGVREPEIAHGAHGSPLRFLALAPVAMAATALNAAVETAGLSFLALYAVALGWAETQATQLMSVMMFGAILLQLPIGWIGDKMDRERLILILAGLSAVGALAWPFVLSSAFATYALLFFWGGAFVGIYTMMLALVGSRFQGAELVGIYAGMGLMWGAGALLGPSLAGLAMQGATHGLPVFVALACAAFLAAALLARRRGPRAA